VYRHIAAAPFACGLASFTAIVVTRFLLVSCAPCLLADVFSFALSAGFLLRFLVGFFLRFSYLLSFDHIDIVDERDDVHVAALFNTRKRIDFVHLLIQPCPGGFATCVGRRLVDVN
jgi:hypothetical protein